MIPGAPGPMQVSTSDLPATPGVYLFRDGDGSVLYIGKARGLRRRVLSYFRAGGNPSLRTRTMLETARTVELLTVRSEREALLLESTLIKTLRPRYNRRLKDARSYPCLVIDPRPRSPRVMLTWHAPDDGAECFGPFPDVPALRSTLQVVRRLYTVRQETFERRAYMPTAVDQARMARDLLAVLNGSNQTLLRRIEKAMRQAADALEFRRAARLRRALQAIEALAGATPACTAGAAAGTVNVVARGIVDLAADRHVTQAISLCATGRRSSHGPCRRSAHASAPASRAVPDCSGPRRAPVAPDPEPAYAGRAVR